MHGPRQRVDRSASCRAFCRGGDPRRRSRSTRLRARSSCESGRRRLRTPTCASRRMFGFAGGDFLGQRTFTARTNAKGEWALIGVQGRHLGVRRVGAGPAARRGRAAVQSGRAGRPGDRPPHRRPGIRSCGCRRLPAGDIGPNTRRRRRGRGAPRAADRVTPLLARLGDSNDADVLAAAGSICLLDARRRDRAAVLSSRARARPEVVSRRARDGAPRRSCSATSTTPAKAFADGAEPDERQGRARLSLRGDSPN